MLSPPPGHLRNRTTTSTMYNHSSFAMSAPNILRSRGETVPIGRSFPGNIPGEYESDQDQDLDHDHDPEYNIRQESEEVEVGDHHLVTPYYPTSTSVSASFSFSNTDRSRQTSSSTHTSNSQFYPQPSPSYSLPTSHRTLPNLAPHSGHAFGQTQNQQHHNYRGNGNQKRFIRPGTGSTVASIGTGGTSSHPVTPSSTRSPLSGPRTRVESQPQPPLPTHNPALAASHLLEHAIPFTPPRTQNQNLPNILLINTDIPLTSPRSNSQPPELSKRLAPIYTFLTTPELGYEQGVQGVQEWADFWVGRGVRVRDLTRDLGGLIKGSLSLHPNLPLIQRVMQSPKIQLHLPPNLHQTYPLLSSQGFWEINKKTVVDCLVQADRRYNHTQKGEDGLAAAGSGSAGKSGSGRKRFRSNSGSDLHAREAQLEDEFQARDAQSGVDSATLSGRVTPSVMAGSTLSRFLSRSNRDRDQTPTGKKSKISIDQNRPASVVQDQADAPVAEEQKPRKLGFLRRMTRSGRQESSNNVVNSASERETYDDLISSKTLGSIFGASGSKIRSKDKSQRKSKGKVRPEDLQIRSVDRTIRPKEDPRDDDEVPAEVVRSKTFNTHSDALHGIADESSTSAPRYSSSSKLRVQQVQEVLLAYIFKRMTSWDLKKELCADPTDDGEGLTASGSERGGTLSRSGSRLASRRPSRGSEAERAEGRNSKRGMMELEALNAKLAQIEFEMILNCGRHFHPAIQSALHKVRFHMGYCSSVQLVKRLNALDREFHRDVHGREVEVGLSDAEKHRVSIKIESWLRVRWDIIDRWELAKIVKEEVLGKIPDDLRELVQNAMRAVLLPSTPFPPFRSSASNFKVGGLPPHRNWGQRRPSLPATLSTWGGSTPNLTAGSISHPSSQRSLIDEARTQTLLFDILALPTVPNTRELLIEWIPRTRHRQLIDTKGWWVAMSETQSGVDLMDDALNLVESGCADKHHFHLIPVFDEVREAFLLPEKSTQVMRRTEAIRQAEIEARRDNERWRQEVTVQVKSQPQQPVIVQEPVRPTGFVIKRPGALTGTALQIITDALPPMGPTLSPLAESTSGQPDEVCAKVELSSSEIDKSQRPDESSPDDSEPSTAVHETFSRSESLDGMKLGASLPSPLEMNHHITRHRKGMSKMSVFSSETALEMASIFATRDSASRASHRSLVSPEPDSGPTPKLSPLAEESPRLPSENDPIEAIIAPSPARSRLRSIPLSDEVLSDGEAVARDPLDVADGEISPYPKATSPPRPIPDRSTSLQHTVSTVQQSPSSTFGPDSILKRTPQPTPEPRRFVMTMPSTLSQILYLFEPGTTRLAPGLSPGMLEIELLKIVELERQKASMQGLIWSRQDTVRVSWLLEEVKYTLNLAHIDHIFDRVRCSLVSHCQESSASTEHLPSISLSRDESQGDETSSDRPPQSARPMSTLITQLGEEKAALSPGQLRLVNPSGPPVLAEPVGGLGIAFDHHRPFIRSSQSFHDGMSGLGCDESTQLHQRAQTSSTEARHSRRVSFAGYDSNTPSPPDIAVTIDHAPITSEAALLVNGFWQHHSKDAPPPYHPEPKRARSGSP